MGKNQWPYCLSDPIDRCLIAKYEYLWMIQSLYNEEERDSWTWILLLKILVFPLELGEFPWILKRTNRISFGRGSSNDISIISTGLFLLATRIPSANSITTWKTQLFHTRSFLSHFLFKWIIHLRIYHAFRNLHCSKFHDKIGISSFKVHRMSYERKRTFWQFILCR